MKHIGSLSLAVVVALGMLACGDKKDSASSSEQAQKVIQEGMQKEKAMMEGMQKGVEGVEKKMAEDAAKK